MESLNLHGNLFVCISARETVDTRKATELLWVQSWNPSAEAPQSGPLQLCQARCFLLPHAEGQDAYRIPWWQRYNMGNLKCRGMYVKSKVRSFYLQTNQVHVINQIILWPPFSTISLLYNLWPQRDTPKIPSQYYWSTLQQQLHWPSVVKWGSLQSADTIYSPGGVRWGLYPLLTQSKQAYTAPPDPKQ